MGKPSKTVNLNFHGSYCKFKTGLSVVDTVVYSEHFPQISDNYKAPAADSYKRRMQDLIIGFSFIQLHP
jgi:hypothetical protein